MYARLITLRTVVIWSGLRLVVALGGPVSDIRVHSVIVIAATLITAFESKIGRDKIVVENLGIPSRASSAIALTVATTCETLSSLLPSIL